MWDSGSSIHKLGMTLSSYQEVYMEVYMVHACVILVVRPKYDARSQEQAKYAKVEFLRFCSESWALGGR